MSKTLEPIDYTDEELNRQERAIAELEALRPQTTTFWEKMAIQSNICNGKRIVSDRKWNININAEM